MFKSLLISSILLISQTANYDDNFVELKNRLQDYGFEVNLAIPPDFQLPKQRKDLRRRRLRKPYGLLSASSKSIWINPIVSELGISNPVLIHEAVHAAQFCKGNGSLEALELDIEPIQQALPFFNRYINIHSRNLEKEAYTVQTQSNSYEIAMSLLDKYC